MNVNSINCYIIGSKHEVKFRYRGDKLWKNLPYDFKNYFVTSKQSGIRIFQILVSFSEYLNFNKIQSHVLLFLTLLCARFQFVRRFCNITSSNHDFRPEVWAYWGSFNTYVDKQREGVSRNSTMVTWQRGRYHVNKTQKNWVQDRSIKCS